MGFHDLVRSNPHAAAVLRMCYVLPLLPHDQMAHGLTIIASIANLNSLDTLQLFLDYVKGMRMNRVNESEPHLNTMFIVFLPSRYLAWAHWREGALGVQVHP